MLLSSAEYRNNLEYMILQGIFTINLNFLASVGSPFQFKMNIFIGIQINFSFLFFLKTRLGEKALCVNEFLSKIRKPIPVALY